MNSGTQARADWRALASAAVIGGGVGLVLGGLYLGAGMGRAIADHQRAVQIAQVGQSLRGPLAADPARAAQSGVQLAGFGQPAAQLAAGEPAHARELDCLAQAVYFEARGESTRGQAAVATVVMNRVKNPHFPKTVCGVVYQGAHHRNGCQFSFACDGRVERVVEQDAWVQARRVAARALSGVVLRDVGKATYYHTTDVAPGWEGSMLRVAQVGLHVFFRLNPHAPPPAAVDDSDEASAEFAARPAPGTQLRLAAAVVAPAAVADSATKPAAPAEAKPAAKAESAASPVPIAKTDAAVAPKQETATAS